MQKHVQGLLYTAKVVYNRVLRQNSQLKAYIPEERSN